MIVRPMAEVDLPDVTALCAQLGYPSTPEQVARRFRLIAADRTPVALFVAEAQDGHGVGFVFVRGVVLIESGPRAEIWGLVVDDAHRGEGVGRALMSRAEAWAREHGYPMMSLRSNVVRGGAHQFYQRLGYEIAKTSYTFRKTLADEEVRS